MKLAIIGVPFDLDQHNQGKGLAPAALLAAGLRERLEATGAAVETIDMITAPLAGSNQLARLGSLLQALAQAVVAARARQNIPLIIGGDCMTALGTLAGLGHSAHTSVAWIDAHGDFNTPTTTLSGYLGGMPLACAAGRGLDELRLAVGLNPLDEANIALLGVRDLDEAEAATLQQSNVTVMSAAAIERRDGDIDGAGSLLAQPAQLYLHLDIDVLHNDDAPGVDFPAPGGLRPAVLTELLAPIARLPNLAAVALTAVNPERDSEQRTVKAALNALETIIQAATNA